MLTTLWRTDRTLTATSLLMVAALLAFLTGLALDPRTILGAPAWLKPAKFAASTAIYGFTLAWLFQYLPQWRRTRRVVGRTTAAVFVLEVAIIAVQAWRGTTSHFNVATPLDAALFSVMGLGILVQTAASVAVAVALWRQPFADAALGRALRVGMIVTIVGASTGGLMTTPTAAQVAEMRTDRPSVAGGHTVGAPDGGPGIPGTGWSREHGDLRVPHFLGLHAIQAFALVALALRRRLGSAPARARLVAVAAAAYVGLFGLLLAQALGGESVVAPSSPMIAAVGAWAVATTAAAWAAVRRAAVTENVSAAVLV